jgi:integrase
MPAEQRGSAYRLDGGKWGLRFYNTDGKRRRVSPFASKSAAMRHFRTVIEPELRGEPARAPDLTLDAFVDLFLERHAATVRPRTIATLRERLAYATKAFGDVPLLDLGRMAGEIASWRATLPERSRYAITSALRQALAAAVRWGYMTTNPAVQAGRNPQPSPRTIRTYTPVELDALAAELSVKDGALVRFAAATGLRPEEWMALTRADVDRTGRTVTVRRTVSAGATVELGKTSRSLREVPLSRRALDALEALPARLDTPLLFPGAHGGLRNLHHWRSRVWHPAVDAAAIRKPARIYDLRSTFASDALAAGVSIFTLARIMGTSVLMIERSYGTLLDGAGAGIAGRLDALDADRERAAEGLGH